MGEESQIKGSGTERYGSKWEEHMEKGEGIIGREGKGVEGRKGRTNMQGNR